MQLTCPLNHTSAHVKIYSISHFDPSIIAIKPSIVFADLDDTVFTPGSDKGYQFFCGSIWFNFNTYQQSHQTLHWHFDMFNVCANKTQYIPVSLSLNRYLMTASEEIPVFGLTARLEDTRAFTVQNLAQIEFAFSSKKHPMAYQGVIFAGSDKATGHSNHKGEVILRALKSIESDSNPHILFIDDNFRNIQQVNETLTQNGIAATLIHLAHIEQFLFSEYSAEEIRTLSEVQQHHFLIHKEFLNNLDVISKNQCIAYSYFDTNHEHSF